MKVKTLLLMLVIYSILYPITTNTNFHKGYKTHVFGEPEKNMMFATLKVLSPPPKENGWKHFINNC